MYFIAQRHVKHLAQFSGKVSYVADFECLSPKTEGRTLNPCAPESPALPRPPSPGKKCYIRTASSKMEFPIAWEEIHDLSQYIKMLHPVKTILTIIDKIPWSAWVFQLSGCRAAKQLGIWKPLPALIFFPGCWGLWSCQASCCRVGLQLSGPPGREPVGKHSGKVPIHWWAN